MLGGARDNPSDLNRSLKLPEPQFCHLRNEDSYPCSAYLLDLVYKEIKGDTR